VTALTVTDPVYDFTTEDDIRHTLWVMQDPAAIAAVEQAFAGMERLYIADGHHRAAACRPGQSPEPGKTGRRLLDGIVS